MRQFTTSAAEGQYATKDRRIVNLEYFNNGEVKKITRWEGAVATTDALITNVTLANSGWIQGRTGGISHTGMAGTVATQGYTWTYDVPGRITGSTITGSNPETKTFTYDSNDQLTGVTGSQTLSRTYDVNGNLTGTGVTVIDNQLTNDGTYSYLYDKNGNRTQRTKLDGSYEKYTWDRRNRLTSVASYTITNVKTKEIQYQYDGLDRRIRRKVDLNGNGVFTDAGDLQERFVYDTNVQNPSYSEVVQVLDESNNFAVKHRFLNGPALDQVFSDQTADGNILWLMQDNQQTVTDVADFGDSNNDGSADGKAKLVNHLIYNALGQVTAADNPQTTTSTTDGILPGLNTAGSPQQAYTGQLYDPQTGLYYYDARWFDPFTNQFISEDPIGFAAGDTNLRRYVGNSNPNATDPSGLDDVKFDIYDRMKRQDPRPTAEEAYEAERERNHQRVLANIARLNVEAAEQQARDEAFAGRTPQVYGIVRTDGSAGFITDKVGILEKLEPTTFGTATAPTRYGAPGANLGKDVCDGTSAVLIGDKNWQEIRRQRLAQDAEYARTGNLIEFAISVPLMAVPGPEDLAMAALLAKLGRAKKAAQAIDAVDDVVDAARTPVSRTNWGPEHGKGNVPHNNAIEDLLDEAHARGATDLRKNRVQRDVNGIRVCAPDGKYTRPDGSYIEDGVRHNYNRVSNLDDFEREIEAFKRMIKADPNATNSLEF